MSSPDKGLGFMQTDPRRRRSRPRPRRVRGVRRPYRDRLEHPWTRRLEPLRRDPQPPAERTKNESDTQSGGELTQIVNSLKTASPDIQLYQYDLNDDASSKAPVSLANVNVPLIDHAIELDFGANGLSGSPNTTTADGYYELDIKLPSGATAVHHFYRLLGDVSGDGAVDNNDLNEIAAEINLSNPTGLAPLGADVNGDGTISALDLTLATRAKGHKLKSGLSLG